MSQFSGTSALEKHVQFRSGFGIVDRIGKYKAPAAATDDGTVVKLGSDGETLEACGDNDGQFILEQAVAASGPIGSAANREKWLSNIPQAAVAVGAEVTVYPIKSGGVIWTDNIATGTTTGAITAATVTPGETEFECYGGVWRVLQGASPMGVILSDPDDDDGVELLFY